MNPVTTLMTSRHTEGHQGAHHGVFYQDGHVPAPIHVTGLTSTQDHYPVMEHQHLQAKSPNKAYRSPRRIKGKVVRVFLQKFTLEGAIGSYACSLEASRCVTNDIPLG